MEKTVLSIDVGTTNVKASIWNSTGNILASLYTGIGKIQQNVAMVEQDPVELWDKILKTVSDVIEIKKNFRENLIGIGITNQRESVIAWDSETMKPISAIISWQDRRTSKETYAIRKNYGSEVEDISGLVVDPYFSATKIKWILDNIEESRFLHGKGRLRIGTLDSWIVNKLTMGKSYFTDHTNASRTMIMNLRKGSWDENLLSIFSIPEDILPEIRPSSSNFGQVTQKGPLYGKDILSVAGDQQSSIIGMGRVSAGETKITIGTGTFMISSSGKDFRRRKGILSTCLYSDEGGHGNYALEGSSFFSGSLLDYLKQNMFENLKIESVDPYHGSSTPEGCVYFVPALSGLGSPFWDPGATGTIIGIGPSTNWKDISASALRSIAFRINDMICAMQEGDIAGDIWVDGGVSKNLGLMQFISDITGLNLMQAPNPDHVTGRGAANLAFRTLDHHDLAEWTMEKHGRKFTPVLSRENAKDLYSGWLRSLERSWKWHHDSY
ncbi:FGGY family carbohydrate kinase [Oxyplasma meridianum]|uniref:ATP:glycerol 3-phosphotransferase n=1 Tax=Oxyplasma meridianum TaxID=3073602 RepID=A0AAX4NIT9_9ARCH